MRFRSLALIATLITSGLGWGKTHSSYMDWGPYPPVAPFTRSVLPSQKSLVGLIFPLIGPCHWSNDYNVSRGRYRHTGIDIKAPKWTPIVASFSGVLGMKPDTFWIYGDNGWALLGTHLNDDEMGKRNHRGSRDVMFAPNLVPGQRVKAGQFIGYVGESGNATGPHLHFELYAPGSSSIARRLRNPFLSLKYAQVLRAPRAFGPSTELHPDPGQVRLDGCVRRVDAGTGKVTFLLTGKQLPHKRTEVIDHPRYIKVALDYDSIEAAGGWSGLEAMRSTDTVSFFLPLRNNLDGAKVSRLIVAH